MSQRQSIDSPFFRDATRLMTRRLTRAVSFAAALGPALALGVAAAGAMAESVEYDLTTTAFTSSADYSQAGFSPAETHDGNIEAAAPPYDGWAVDPFEGDSHQILWAFVAGETAVDAIQLIHVYDDNEVLHHFQLYYTTDSNPTLASTFQELTGLQMVLNTSGDGATIVGSEVQVTSTTAITTGEYRLTFDHVNATAIQLRSFADSGTDNGNFVLSEISMRSSPLCANVTCQASDQCHGVGSCDYASGLCSDPALADGTSCDDGDATTTSDQCAAGVCGGTNLCANVTCLASDQCHEAGTCEPTTGLCSDPVLQGSAPCDDGDVTTVNDQCMEGLCVGGDLCANVTCSVPPDQCHGLGSCHPLTGACVYPNVPVGTRCDDGDPATADTFCVEGVCGEAGKCEGVTCVPSDQCHLAGGCDPASGLCADPVAPDGAPCNDGDDTTQNDQCVAGLCGGTDSAVPLLSPFGIAILITFLLGAATRRWRFAIT